MIINLSGGGAQKPYAVIGVEHPSGSTASCTKSGAVSKLIYHSSTRTMFSVPSTGVWTVGITDSSHSTPATQNVSISAQGQVVSVNLAYWSGELYDAGNEYTSVTGGWYEMKPAVTKTSSGITATQPSPYAGVGGQAATTNLISLTGWTKIRFDFEYVTVQSPYGYVKIVILDSSGTEVATKSVANNASSAEISVSSLSGNYRITLLTGGNYDPEYVWSVGSAKITKVKMS